VSNGKRIIITGATGQVGKPLSRQLIEQGYEVVVFSRTPDQARSIVPGAVDYVAWQAEEMGPWAKFIDGAYGVVSLAGAPFFRKWKNREEFERRGTGSRILGNRGLVNAMRQAAIKPRVFVSASAVGHYGFTDSDEWVTEDTPAGADIWGLGNAAWEAEAAQAETLGVRTVRLRTGVVFSRDEGMTANMLPQFRAGWGAVILPGTQWLPWIHIADEVGLIMFALEDERVRGPLNASAPEPVRFREFAQTFGRVLGKRVWLRLPGLFIQLGLGEVAASVLHNRRMIPRKALDLGYPFQFPKLEPALRDLTKS